MHKSGKRYEWDAAANPESVRIASAPGWIKDLLSGASTAPRRKRPAVVTGDPAATLVGHAFGAAGLAVGAVQGVGIRPVECPWSEEHTDGRGRGEDTSSALLPPLAEAKRFGGWRCAHAHCTHRGVADLLTKLPKEAWIEADRLYPNQLSMQHREAIGLPPDLAPPPEKNLHVEPPVPPPPHVVFFADAGYGDIPPPVPSPASPNEDPAPPPRPRVRLGPDVHRICVEVRRELATANAAFRMGSDMVMVHEGTIYSVKSSALAAMISKVCDVERYDGRSKSFQRVVAPRDLCATIIDWQTDHELNKLRGVAMLPFVSPGGELVTTPGYHPESEYVLDPGRDFSRVQIDRERLTQADAAKALVELYDVVCDFPFVDEVHAYGWIALVLTLMGRAAIDGCTPLFAFDASAPGSGKSALAKSASVIATGEEFVTDASVVAESEEMRKVISATVKGGEPMFFLDNFVGVMRSPPLEAALTSRYWSDRQLSTNDKIKAVIQTVFAVSANNIKFGNDITRRTVAIRLVPSDNPTLRNKFKNGEIMSYVRKQRFRLYSAALTILAAHAAAGRPHEAEPRAGFEEWASTVASAIVWAGGRDVGALFADRVASDDGVEDDDDARATVLEQLSRMFPAGGKFRSRELYARLWGTDNQRGQWEDLAEAFEMLRPGVNERGWTLKSVAYLLRDMRDRPVGKMVLRSRKSHGVARFSVEALRSPP